MALSLTLRKHRNLKQALAYFLSYAGWTVAYRLLILTLITWLLMSAHARFQDISDFYGSNEILLIGVGSLIFIGLLIWLNPLTSTTFEGLINVLRFEKRFVPGFLRGSLLALGIAAAFLLSGVYSYLGFYFQLEEAPLALLGILLRISALIAIVYCEEYIFRYKIMGYLRREMRNAWAIPITAVLYCATKAIQFDLGWMHLITLFLISIALAIRTVVDGDFARGAGFWAGLLVVFHPLLSLPIFGSDVQGILLLKLQTGLIDLAAFRALTGGYGGPLSSVALQFLLVIDVAQGIVKHRRILLN